MSQVESAPVWTNRVSLGPESASEPTWFVDPVEPLGPD